MYRPIVKTPGGKFYLYKWILNEALHHTTFVESMFGGGSITLNHRGAARMVGVDLNPYLINMYKQFSDESILEIINKVEYSRESFDWSLDYKDEKDPRVQAVKYFTLNRHSRDGMMTNFVDSQRLRGGQPENRNSFKTIKESLINIIPIIKNIEFRCQDSIQTILEFKDDPDACIVADPPYVHKTRNSKNLYKEYEWDDNKHIEFLNSVQNSRAQILVCGYECDLYDDYLNGWNKHLKPVTIKMGGTKKDGHKSQKIETLWSSR